MKKILSIVLVVALLSVAVFALAACNDDKSVKVIEIPLTEEEYAFGINKNDPELLAQVNQIIDEIMADGTFNEITSRYFGENLGGKNITSHAKDASKDQLLVATNAAFAPFESKNGEYYTGIDMEIAQVIADKLNKELVIVDMDFDAVVTSVQQGTADIAMAGLTVSAERAEQVNFSKTYYRASQVVIVKEGDTTFDGCATAADVENVLKGLTGKKAGYQRGTTGGLYLTGDAEMGFAGFANIESAPYSNGALAVQDMINGNLDLVIIDEAPASMIANSFNK